MGTGLIVGPALGTELGCKVGTKLMDGPVEGLVMGSLLGMELAVGMEEIVGAPLGENNNSATFSAGQLSYTCDSASSFIIV